MVEEPKEKPIIVLYPDILLKSKIMKSILKWISIIAIVLIVVEIAAVKIVGKIGIVYREAYEDGYKDAINGIDPLHWSQDNTPRIEH